MCVNMCMGVCVNACVVWMCVHICVSMHACMCTEGGYRIDVHGIQVAEAATEAARLRKAEGVCTAALMP